MTDPVNNNLKIGGVSYQVLFSEKEGYVVSWKDGDGAHNVYYYDNLDKVKERYSQVFFIARGLRKAIKIIYDDIKQLFCEARICRAIINDTNTANIQNT